jgi:hypothetical protein
MTKQQPLSGNENTARWSRRTIGGWYAEAAPPADGQSSPPPAIDIDGKKITADDYKNLQSQFTKTSQALSLVDTAAKKYNMTPDEYIEQAEGAFGVAAKLISDGIIDENGNILVNRQAPPPASPDKRNDGLPPAPGTGTALERRLSIVEKALEGIGDIHKSLGGIKEDQSRLVRLDLQRQIQAKHPGITEEDTHRILARAMNDRKKDLWTHASEYEAQKKESETELRRKFASDYGLDFEKLEAKRNPNRLNETGPEGGVGAMFANKKFKFNAGKKDENAVSPRKAMEEYFRTLNEEGK